MTEMMTTPDWTPAHALQEKKAWATALSGANLLPAAYRKQPANLLLAAEYADTLGVPRMTALTGIHVIKGKPTMSADLMGALVRRAGHRLRVSGDAHSATAILIRADDPDYSYEATWTMARAKQAGLIDKKDSTWRIYPEALLRARAVTEVCRMGASEILFGAGYTPEELGASVGMDGNPVEIEFTPVTAESESQVEVETTGEAPEPDSQPTVEGSVTVDDVAATVDVGLLREWWGTASPEVRTVIEARVQRIQDSVGDGPSKEDTPDSPVEEVDSITDKQIVALNAGISGVVGDDRDQKLEWLSNALKREITSSRDVSKDEASRLIDWFNQSNAGEDQ